MLSDTLITWNAKHFTWIAEEERRGFITAIRHRVDPCLFLGLRGVLQGGWSRTGTARAVRRAPPRPRARTRCRRRASSLCHLPCTLPPPSCPSPTLPSCLSLYLSSSPPPPTSCLSSASCKDQVPDACLFPLPPPLHPATTTKPWLTPDPHPHPQIDTARLECSLAGDQSSRCGTQRDERKPCLGPPARHLFGAALCLQVLPGRPGACYPPGNLQVRLCPPC